MHVAPAGRALLPATLLLAATAPALAQAPAAPWQLPFSRGHLGAEFQVPDGRRLIRLGVLVFTSARRAWIVDATFPLYTGTVTPDTNTLNPIARADSRTRILLGRRSYRAVARTVAAYGTLGASGSYRRNVSDAPEISWSAGLYGEAGACVVAFGHLAVGASARLSGEYYHSVRSDAYERQRYRSWSVAGQQLTAVATFYF